MSKPSVFISSSAAGLKTARELARQIESFATPTVWADSAAALQSPLLKSLDEALTRTDFAVFVWTADGSRRGAGPKSAARQNVMFELGFLAGRIGTGRTFVVSEQSIHRSVPSDLAGISHVRYFPKLGKNPSLALAPVATALRQAIEKIEPRESKPIDFYSCFISYSWKDKPFAAKLHDDLVEIGVRCWLDEYRLRPGDRIAESIDTAIRIQDKILLVLSKNSIESQWIKWEIRRAMELEDARKKTLLFPLMLDNAILAAGNDSAFRSLKERLIADFTKWPDKGDYGRAFKLLVQSLAINASVESGGKR
jgi:hypothetical protein